MNHTLFSKKSSELSAHVPGPCDRCSASEVCHQLHVLPVRSICFDCQREFVFLAKLASDALYPDLEGDLHCPHALSRRGVVWCPQCKHELESLLYDQQVPITPETMNFG